MSYLFISNRKLKEAELIAAYKHNERLNKNYSNKDINKKKSTLNYNLKNQTSSYIKEFKEIINKENLIFRKNKNSILACEFIITSDQTYFNSIDKIEQERFFKESFLFTSKYNGLKENYIISANVHLDESTPHMHIIFIPVVNIIDKTTNQTIQKISSSQFWKTKYSYKILQDSFYNYMISKGFNLERGKEKSNAKHIPSEYFKKITDYEYIKFEKNKIENFNLENTTDSIKLQKQKEFLLTSYKKVCNNFIELKSLHQNLNKNYLLLENETKSIKLKYNKLFYHFKKLKKFKMRTLLILKEKYKISKEEFFKFN